MRAAWLICLKDLKARLRDRSALLIGIVVPLGLAFIFNSIFSGISGGSNVISLGVVNADHGAASQQFTSQVLPAVSRSGFWELPVGERDTLTLGTSDTGVLPEAVVVSAKVTLAVMTMVKFWEKDAGAT